MAARLSDTVLDIDAELAEIVNINNRNLRLPVNMDMHRSLGLVRTGSGTVQTLDETPIEPRPPAHLRNRIAELDAIIGTHNHRLATYDPTSTISSMTSSPRFVVPPRARVTVWDSDTPEPDLNPRPFILPPDVNRRQITFDDSSDSDSVITENIMSRTISRHFVEHPEIEPITDEDLRSYVTNLKEMSKRRQDIQTVIASKQRSLDDLNGEISILQNYGANMQALFNEFPRLLKTSQVHSAQENYRSVIDDRINRYMSGAIDKRNSFEREIQTLEKYLIDIAAAVSSAAVEPVAKNLCAICMNNTIEVVCDPCGHTFCEQCVKYRANCSMCRANVNKRIKVFFSI